LLLAEVTLDKSAPSMNASIRSWTLIRKTSLLHKIGPMTRRSSFVNKIVLQLASSHDEPSAENDLEIVKDPRKLLCTIQLGSISSSRCQKSRMLLHPELSNAKLFVFADGGVGRRRWPAFAQEGFGAAAFASCWLAEP
jgi:hypothetical protein